MIGMKIKIIVGFEIKDPFNYQELKKRIKAQFNVSKKQFDLKNLKLEFHQKNASRIN